MKIERRDCGVQGGVAVPEDTQDVEPVPGFFTPAFQQDFFVPLLIRSIRAKESGRRSPFEGHVPLEFPVLLVVSVVAAIIGLPAYRAHGSVIGGIAGLAGVAGFLVLLVNSIGTPPNRTALWTGFMAPTFMVCVLIGITVGLFLGAVVWKTVLAKWALGVVGLLAGYVAGIAAGLGMQWLGWIGRLLQAFAIPLIIGLIALDIVLIVI
jgi:hypothetical protein